jgi:hypothetical protein
MIEEKKDEKIDDENIQVKAQCVTLATIIASILPLIWQSIIEAIVVFFTTVGLESWWISKENKKDPKDQ